MKVHSRERFSPTVLSAVPTVHLPFSGEIVEGGSVDEVAENLLAAVRLWVRRRDGHLRRKPRLRHATFDVWRVFAGFELDGQVRAMLFEVESLLSDATRPVKSRVHATNPPGEQVAATPPRRPLPVDARGHLLFGFPGF